MEIGINSEIRDYHEGIILGLSARQVICSALAILVAVALNFLLRAIFGGTDLLGDEIINTATLLVAAPFAIAAFFSYNGMTFERFVWAFIKSELLMAGNRVWRAKNYYLERLQKEDENKNGLI